MKVRPQNHPDRAIDLQEGLDDIIFRATEKLNAAGFSTKEVLDGFLEVIVSRWKAYDEDPDLAAGTQSRLETLWT